MKRIGFFVIVLLILLGGWYFLVRTADYKVTFKANTSVGAVNQTLKSWHNSLANKESFDQEGLGELTQQLKFKDSIHTYVWTVFPVENNKVKVSIEGFDRDHSLANRLQILLRDSDFEARVKERASEFLIVLNTHLENTNVTIEGEAMSPAVDYAYVELEGVQSEKAGGMMLNYNFITGLMLKGNIKQKGSPFIEVNRWDKKTDSIYYRFCFPIIKTDSLPQHPRVKYGKRESEHSIKAIYNGNYMTSDRAWYAIEEYANNNNIKLDLRPLEVFYNNPHMGGNEAEWKTEVYLPISKE